MAKIIVELCQNHNGDRNILRDMIWAAKENGADIVKGQVIFSEDTPLKVIQAIRPQVLVKGGDWKKKDVVGGSFVETYGGAVRLVPYVRGFSTSELLRKIQTL